MTPRFCIKLTLVFVAGFLLLTGVNLMFLFDNSLDKAPIQVVPQAQASNFPAKKQTTSTNLSAQNLSAKSRSEDGIYRTGIAIDVTCTIGVAAESPSKESLDVIRTQYGNIVSAPHPIKKDESNYVISGGFTPEKSGITHIACRTDVDNQIEESKETDNRAVLTIFVADALPE